MNYEMVLYVDNVRESPSQILAWLHDVIKRETGVRAVYVGWREDRYNKSGLRFSAWIDCSLDEVSLAEMFKNVNDLLSTRLAMVYDHSREVNKIVIMKQGSDAYV